MHSRTVFRTDFVKNVLSNRFCRTGIVEQILILSTIFSLFCDTNLLTIWVLPNAPYQTIFFKQILLSTIISTTGFVEQNHIVQPLVVFKVRVWYADLCSCSHTLIDGEHFQTELSSWGPYYRKFHNCNFCYFLLKNQNQC